LSSTPHEIVALIESTVRDAVAHPPGVTRYRTPLVGFARADDPRFGELRDRVHPGVLLPTDVLPSARSVISFFLPFDPSIVRENAAEEADVAEAWVTAYLETNDLLNDIARELVLRVDDVGVRAAARPATGELDRLTLTAPWPHKSAAVIAGLGSFGVHQMVITDAGCAGRFNTVVTDAELPAGMDAPRERCAYHRDGSCLECVRACPVGALAVDHAMDRQKCWTRCQSVAERFRGLGQAEVCGKCAVAACALGPPS
jgi:epoxyqueuosine reductase QueG